MAKRLSLKQAQLIRQHGYILEKLAKSTARDRKTILQNAPSELFKALNLIFRLVANEELELSKSSRNVIKRHKRLIRSTSKLGTRAIKGRLVRQRGGSLPKILSTILPIVGAIVKSVI